MYQPDWERYRRALDLPRSKRQPESAKFILDVVFAAYRFVFRNFATFLLYAFGPIVVSSLPIAIVLLSSITHTVDGDFIEWMGIHPDLYPNFPTLIWFSSLSVATIISIALYIAFSLISVSFAVAWHRRCLLGPTQTSLTELFNWRLRNLRFLGYCVIIFVFEKLSLAVARIFGIGLNETIESGFLIAIIMLGVFVAFISVLIGFLLVFPAAAVDDTRTGLLESRKHSRGHKWRIFISLLLGVALPFALIAVGFEKFIGVESVLDYWASSFWGSAFVILFLNLINFMTLAVAITVLSMFYKELVDDAPIPREPAEPGTV